MEKTETKSVKVDVITEFIDSFSKLDHEKQLVLLGMLKGMVAANEMNAMGGQAS